MNGNNIPQAQQHDLIYVNNANIHIQDEEITLVLHSGTKAHYFGFAPKHFKQFMELVEQKQKEYEQRFGKIA
jgi:hypothetical protein